MTRAPAPRDLALRVQRLLADESARWSALVVRLDGAGDGVLYAGAGVAWDAREVYAHLARWFDVALDSFAADATSRPLPDVADWDTRNLAWHAADRARTLGDARAHAVAAHDRLIAGAQALPAALWTDALCDRFEGCAPGHYAEHLAYLSAGRHAG